MHCSHDLLLGNIDNEKAQMQEALTDVITKVSRVLDFLENKKQWHERVHWCSPSFQFAFLDEKALQENNKRLKTSFFQEEWQGGYYFGHKDKKLDSHRLRCSGCKTGPLHWRSKNPFTIWLNPRSGKTRRNIFWLAIRACNLPLGIKSCFPQMRKRAILSV